MAKAFFLQHIFHHPVFLAWLKRILQRPWRNFFLTLAFLIALGTVLLYLPASTRQGIPWVDALFTAVSACTLTGLSIYDTGGYFTTFGHCVILFLVQSSAFLILFFASLWAGDTQFSSAKGAKEELWQAASLARRVFLFMFWVEFLGLLLVFFSMNSEGSWGRNLFFALFHCVSAFCNAGFSLYRYNMEGYCLYPYFNAVILVLIVAGSWGFACWNNIKLSWQRKEQLSEQTRWIVRTNLILVLLGTLVILGCEAFYSLTAFSWKEKIWIALFQSSNCRTAGFHTISYLELSSVTVVFCMLLMLVGGAPASVAGGLKVTTLVHWLRSYRGNSPERLPLAQLQARSAVRYSLLLVAVCSVLLLLLEAREGYLYQHPRSVLIVVFEIISALSNTGLSLGLTTHLSAAGKILIMLLMLSGRLWLFFIVLRFREHKNWS